MKECSRKYEKIIMKKRDHKHKRRYLTRFPLDVIRYAITSTLQFLSHITGGSLLKVSKTA